LPEKNIKNGDPYQNQIEKTVAAIVDILAIDNLDHAICYQSKVGRLQWLKPSTEDEIIRAGTDEVPVIIVPISFVSEHSETLVELDIKYRKLAKKHNISNYRRVKSLQTDENFINALANMCLSLKEDDKMIAFEKNNKIAA
jgi:ferrochelatase